VTNLTMALEHMLAELEGNRLEVVLVPQKRRTNEGGCVRVAVSKNCAWYRAFCRAHPSSRLRRNSASDTRIKRFRTVDALEKMIAGQRSTYYFAELRRIAERMAK
jgi:hypothetical protein